MRLFSLLFIQGLLSLNAVIASSESSSIHIAVLEDSTLVEKTPFRARVHVYAPSPLETDQEFQEHGASVCSVLVGEKSTLPVDTSITLVPSLKDFDKYIDKRDTQELIILNWSGCVGYPEISEEVLENLESLSQHFKTITEMDACQFTQEVHAYIDAYEGMLAHLPKDDNPLTILLSYAKTCLIEASAAPSQLGEKKEHYRLGILEKITHFKEHAREKANLRFFEMKTSLIECLQKHDNTLIVWALGNDGECIDQDPFWHGILSEKIILDHTLLVQGNQLSGRKSMESNFTVAFKDHCLGKPYRCQVWSAQDSRYVQQSGTSFSAPLATIDAFVKAKEVLEQTREMPLYDVVKHALLTGRLLNAPRC